MPFDGIADSAAAKSLQALELIEDRLQGGRKWTRHFLGIGAAGFNRLQAAADGILAATVRMRT
jgi:hypothetical protein